MLLSALFAMVSSAILVFSGISFSKKQRLKAGMLFMLGGLFIFVTVYSARAPFSLLRDGEVRNAAYVVEYRLDDTDGKTTILFMSDAKTGTGRVAVLSHYPPEGYKEVNSPDRLPLLLNESLIRSPPPNK